MKYNTRDGIWYVHSTEYSNDTTMAPIKEQETAKIYVYETGKTYISDGEEFHEQGVTDS